MDEKDLVLEPGEHCLPFSCRLLADLPSSFEGQHGCIRYVAKAIIEQTSSSSSSSSISSAKSDVIIARLPFTMAPGLNLCLLPEATVSRIVYFPDNSGGHTIEFLVVKPLLHGNV